jgi:hypothetical protein
MCPEVAAAAKEFMRLHDLTKEEFAAEAEINEKRLGRLLNEHLATPATTKKVKARLQKTE